MLVAEADTLITVSDSDRLPGFTYRVGKFDLAFPPDHPLPTYQQQHPTYDTYYLPWMRELIRWPSVPNFLDVGANVGDTCAAWISTTPNAAIFAVEGCAEYLPYLRENSRLITTGITVIPSYVTPEGTPVVDKISNGTASTVLATSGIASIPIEEILARFGPFDLIKLDTDGLDGPLLNACLESDHLGRPIIAVEVDGTLGFRDWQTLLKRAEQKFPAAIVVDNFGRPMFALDRCWNELTTQVMGWLNHQTHSNFRSVFYLDLWLFPTVRLRDFKRIRHLCFQ